MEIAVSLFCFPSATRPYRHLMTSECNRVSFYGNMPLLKFKDPAWTRQHRATAQTLICIRLRGEMEPFPGGRV